MTSPLTLLLRGVSSLFNLENDNGCWMCLDNEFLFFLIDDGLPRAIVDFALSLVCFETEGIKGSNDGGCIVWENFCATLLPRRIFS